MDCLCADLELPFCPVHHGDENHVGIKRLRAALAAHKRALAAGPARLRDPDQYGTDDQYEAADMVEAAQEAALKGGG